jgi:hypothetical protein
MQKRRRSKPHTFEGRIEEEKKRLQERADLLPHGAAKETLLRKIRQLDTASHVRSGTLARIAAAEVA